MRVLDVVTAAMCTVHSMGDTEGIWEFNATGFHALSRKTALQIVMMRTSVDRWVCRCP